MEEEKKRSNTALWIGLGCLGLIVMACVVGAIAIAASLFITDRSESVSTAPTATELLQLNPTPKEDATLVPDTRPSLEPSPETPLEAEEAQLPETEQSPVPEDTTELPPTNTPPTQGEETAEQSDQITDEPYADLRQEIEAEVVSIRGLEPITDVVPTFLTMEEVRGRVENDMLEEYGPEEARADAITLSAFDFLPADFDLYNFTLDLLTEQIAGFYDPESNEFVVRSDDDEFDSLEQITHAHEFVHALQDQHYDLEKLDDDSLESEEVFAFQAFVEGEATFVQMLFLQSGYFSFDALAQLMMDMLDTVATDTEVLDSAPPIIANQLEFPYVEGLEFVQALYNNGGFQAVDDAWQNPPLSTEHILHPDRYFAGDLPDAVALNPMEEILGSEWELIDEDVLGEYYLREYLAQHLDPSAADAAAAGWGGDRYMVFYNEEAQDLVLILRLAWDSAEDLGEFQNIFGTFAERRAGAAEAASDDGGRCWTADDVLCLYTSGDDSIIVRAPDTAAVQAVAASQMP